MEIRKPNNLELEEIIAFSPQALFDGTLGGVRATNEKVLNLIEPLLKKGCYYLIATENNELMGWILIGENTDQFTEQLNGFIYELFVKETYRGRGISKELMKVAIELLRKEGYSEVRLSAYVGNNAIKLYEKMGFSLRTVSMKLQL
ncbi:acetyltransferase [Lysinibacillus sp. FJAT-14745]|uniref:GNAT family N-acetyltransferase n=1 Tax=Lysinibacillus sp. FJAT-14745 TaxID=1704289 RepID=UPI0006ABA27C|nr:GNAT family N-acetyltransferase [Lysinibacillus sp. FJAT-14745]KOP69671.1 acetyltransferase [Lysinibacillus sp. FJAT-14745]